MAIGSEVSKGRSGNSDGAHMYKLVGVQFMLASWLVLEALFSWMRCNICDV